MLAILFKTVMSGDYYFRCRHLENITNILESITYFYYYFGKKLIYDYAFTETQFGHKIPKTLITPYLRIVFICWG